MVDEIDENIIKALMENSRKTYVEIGAAVGLSEGAVRNRVQALVTSGTIRRFTLDVAPSIRVRSLTMIAVEPSIPTHTISEKVRELSGIETIYEVTGEYDIVCVVSHRDIEGLNETIEDVRKLDGIVKTNTVIVLKSL